MRTTIDLPDALFRQLKTAAAQRGSSIKEVVRKAVEEEIRKDERAAGRRLKFPLLASHDPGALDPSNAELDDFSS